MDVCPGDETTHAVPDKDHLLPVAPILLPEYRHENAGRIDLASAALSLLAVLTMIYGIKHAAQAARVSSGPAGPQARSASSLSSHLAAES